MSGNVAPKIITDGLILYLDAANPTSLLSGSSIWYDISKLRSSGSIINNPTYVTTNGGGLLFDGVNDYVTFGTNQNYYFNLTKPFTLSVWFKANTIKNSGLINRFNGGVLGNHFIWMNSDGRMFFHREITPFNLYTIKTITTGVTYNIVGTYDGINKRIYFNGELDNTVASGNIVQNQSNLNLLLGSRQSSGSPSDFFDGIIYNVKIYNKALSTTEVLQNYNVLKNRFI
jgi:hypothetical protein